MIDVVYHFFTCKNDRDYREMCPDYSLLTIIKTRQMFNILVKARWRGGGGPPRHAMTHPPNCPPRSQRQALTCIIFRFYTFSLSIDNVTNCPFYDYSQILSIVP